MKKLILTIPFILFSCTQENHIPVKSNSSTYLDTLVADSDMIEKTELMLEKTKDIEKEIEETYHTKEILIKENKVLKQELNEVTKELIETKSKLPKKQNFIQKVLNIKPDSIEVTTIDTIQK